MIVEVNGGELRKEDRVFEARDLITRANPFRTDQLRCAAVLTGADERPPTSARPAPASIGFAPEYSRRRFCTALLACARRGRPSPNGWRTRSTPRSALRRDRQAAPETAFREPPATSFRYATSGLTRGRALDRSRLVGACRHRSPQCGCAAGQLRGNADDLKPFAVLGRQVHRELGKRRTRNSPCPSAFSPG